jgi:hypothetical protein
VRGRAGNSRISRTSRIYRDGKTLQPFQEAVNLISSDALAAMSHYQSIGHFIEPQNCHQRALFGAPCETLKAVLSVRFVFQKLLECEGGVQHETAHRR